MTLQTKAVICRPFNAVKLTNSDKAFLRANDINLTNAKLNGETHLPCILIGLDWYNNLCSKVEIKLPSGLLVTKTIFGPAIYGRGSLDPHVNNKHKDSTFGTCVIGVMEKTDSHMIKTMYELDGLGISNDEYKHSDETFKYYEKYSKSIEFKDNTIIAPFPLKDNISDLPDNYTIAQRRLQSLFKLHEKESLQKEWYCKIIQSYIDEDIIEQVSDTDINSVGTHYMPHSGVWRPKKPKPLRVVFDASSKQRGSVSLNDVIHTGQSFVNKIHDILVESRLDPIILTCDIEAAFTQIRLPEEHRDLCRFLWLRDPTKPPSQDNIIQYRFKRLPFGVTASPSILNMAIAAYLNRRNTPLATEILQNIYVDNVLLRAKDIEEALQKYKESKALLREIGMNLRDYVSNSKEVNELIPDVDRAPSGNTKLLGVEYNTDKDEFNIRINISDIPKQLTKRSMLSIAHKIYDPIGIVTPLTLKLKLILREVFINPDLDWRTPIPTDLGNKFRDVCLDIANASVTIPRMCNMTNMHNATLWMFADASNAAIATCAYLEDQNTRNISSLISGKTKLAPSRKQLSIPRLELVALLTALRLAKTIQQVAKAAKVNIVSDSQIALSWVKSSRKLPVFVTNQVDRIKKVRSQIENMNAEVNLFYVNTQYNPADIGTRIIEKDDPRLKEWTHGPTWLSTNTSNILQSIDKISSDTVCEDIVDDNPEQIIVAQVEVTQVEKQLPLIDLNRQSSLKKCLRVVAIVGRTLKKWIARTNTNKQTSINSNLINQFSDGNSLTAEDIKLSEMILIRQETQHLDIDDLQKRHHSKRVFKDDSEIIRYRSRLEHALLSYDTKNPIYIPANSDLARLIILNIHNANAHCGKDHTLSLIRQRFWLPKPTVLVKKYIRNCTICKKEQGLPFGAPHMAPLPKDRVITSRVFENTGCDYMGPFNMADESKAYIAIYTCLTTRAIHLEVVESLSAGAFLNSFVRFVSRRGVPRIMRSDCGTNFTLGSKILDSLHQDDNNGQSVMSYSAEHRINWIFNPPSAPWMGGAWERLVGSVKRAFHKAVGRQKLSFTELSTVVTRIEAILNTRPLTKTDPMDLSQLPLRPIDFLQGNLKFAIMENDEEFDNQDDSYDPEVMQTVLQAKQALLFSEKIVSQFWEKWKTDYLTQLRDSHNSKLKQHRHGARTIPIVGEIVLIEQDNVPRGSWSYGRVIEVIPSKDGFIRSAKILMPNGRVLHRPLIKLIPLEIRSAENMLKSPLGNKEQEQVPTRRVQPPRMAKTKAIMNKKDHDSDEYSEDDEIPYHHSSIKKQRLSLVRSAIMLMAIIFLPNTVAASSIKCEEGVLKIHSPEQNYELCMADDCRQFKKSNDPKEYTLPISPHNESIQFHLRTAVHKESIICTPADFCAQYDTLLSKQLLGNPHCWPLGAIISAGIIVYLMVITMMLIIHIIRKKEVVMTNITASVANPSNIEDNPNSSPLTTFTVNIVHRSIAIVAIVALILIIIPSTYACQNGYTRHFAHMTCYGRDRCKFEVKEELLFNRIDSQLCIQIQHNNQTIGIIELKRAKVSLFCEKETLFYTRDTTQLVYLSTRCNQMGSCNSDNCEGIKPDTVVPELIESAVYPGYASCTRVCGNIFCGCLLPLQACNFYRNTYVPNNNNTFHVYRCSKWNPIVEAHVSMTIYNRDYERSVLLHPYISYKFENLRLTAISVSQIHSPLLNRWFAESSSETLMLPDPYTLPVQCNNEEQASKVFHTCSVKAICDCQSYNGRAACNCPPDSITHMKKMIDCQFPIRTSHLSLTTQNNTVVASEHESESIIAIESDMLIDSADLIIDQPCHTNLSLLTGCYNCLEGARSNASCMTSTPSYITIECAEQYFSIECNSSTITTTINLNFDHAQIDEKCHTVCGGNRVEMILKGTLFYHASNYNPSIFDENSQKSTDGGNWKFHIPDFAPLISTFISHWKTTLAIVLALVILIGLTYVFGPIILLNLFHMLITIVLFVIRVVADLISTAISCLAAAAARH